jgi:hypothetical protein
LPWIGDTSIDAFPPLLGPEDMAGRVNQGAFVCSKRDRIRQTPLCCFTGL